MIIGDERGKPGKICPLIAFDQIAGGKYKLRILWVLIRGAKRYGEIRNALLVGTLGKPITPRVLSRELKELERRGFIQRKQYPVVPPKVEYRLTPHGRALIPVMVQIILWARTVAYQDALRAPHGPRTTAAAMLRAS
ncbi:MAG TPA: helix-turn-helix domain-containing protein [Thermoanaerobaculia bacterium]|nr:helix-turn-helix domain-containing protein [Thermoanaerobaculia bacterium]